VQDANRRRLAGRAKLLVVVAVLIVIDVVIAVSVFTQFRTPERPAHMVYNFWYFGQSHGRAGTHLGPAIVATVVCILLLGAAEALFVWFLSSSRLLSSRPWTSD
jgi:hypothetical protein